MMTDFQPPPIFAVQSLGKQQQHHSERKSVRFRHRTLRCLLRFCCIVESMCCLCTGIEYIEDQAKRNFLSVVRVRALFDMISFRVVCSSIHLKYMHMRSVRLPCSLAHSRSLQLRIYVPMHMYRLGYFAHSASYIVLSLYSHIHQEITHKYLRTSLQPPTTLKKI